MEFLLTGMPMSAQLAHEIRLINKVIPNRIKLMDKAKKMADILKNKASLSLRAIKYG